MSDQGPMLTGCISKITTQSAGGYKITIDAPEIMAPVVRQLLGTENKKIYNISFNEIGEIEAAPKQKPGPKPKRDQE